MKTTRANHKPAFEVEVALSTVQEQSLIVQLLSRLDPRRRSVAHERAAPDTRFGPI
jgi:hypothetical protein